MSLRLRLCVENCANESDAKSNLQGIGEGEKPGASCAALLHASTEGTRTCACVSVLREGRGLECVFTHTHRIPPSPLDRCSVPLSITPLTFLTPSLRQWTVIAQAQQEKYLPHMCLAREEQDRPTTHPISPIKEEKRRQARATLGSAVQNG